MGNLKQLDCKLITNYKLKVWHHNIIYLNIYSYKKFFIAFSSCAILGPLASSSSSSDQHSGEDGERGCPGIPGRDGLDAAKDQCCECTVYPPASTKQLEALGFNTEAIKRPVTRMAKLTCVPCKFSDPQIFPLVCEGSGAGNYKSLGI